MGAISKPLILFLGCGLRLSLSSMMGHDHELWHARDGLPPSQGDRELARSQGKPPAKKILLQGFLFS